MKIYLGSDHAGFELKAKIKKHLQDSGFDVEDCGAHQFNPDDDYPDFISKAVKNVSKDPENSKAIIFGGSGQGEAMVANKFSRVRCAIFYTAVAPIGAADITGRKSEDPYEMIRLTREHSDANVLSIGSRFVTEETAVKAVREWLEQPFTRESRHVRRIKKIGEIEVSNG